MNFSFRDGLILLLIALCAGLAMVQADRPSRAEFERLQSQLAALEARWIDTGKAPSAVAEPATTGTRVDAVEPSILRPRVLPSVPQHILVADAAYAPTQSAEASGSTPDADELFLAEPLREKGEPASSTAAAAQASASKAYSAFTSRLEELDNAALARMLAGTPIPDAAASSVIGGGPASQQQAAVNPVPEGPQVNPEEDQTLDVARPLKEGGLLLQLGQATIETQITYSHISKNSVGLSGISLLDVIFIGEIQADSIDRDIVVASTDVRAGLGRDLELGISVPVQYMREEIVGGTVEARNSDVHHRAGLNEVQASLFWQFMRENATWPAMVASMGVKAPTGHQPRFTNGAWAVRPGLLFIKTSDPVVLFGNVGYMHQFRTKLNGQRYEPGNSFEYGLGLAYALNYNVSVHGVFDHAFISETEQAGLPISGSRLVVANFKTGISWILSRNLSCNVAVSTGLTEDSPDFTISLSLPYTF